MLSVKNLSFAYKSKKVLENLSFTVNRGEITTLLGASGSGKTTLFKLITGILPLQEGTISVSDITPPHAHQLVSYLMQEDLLLPWRTVLSNMSLSSELGSAPLPKKARNSEALTLLKEVEMAGCEDLFPDQLSGGMRQRVALARALLKKRPLLLLDEPFGALDVTLRKQMSQLLRTIQAKRGTTMLMVTHDFRDAISLSDHILLLSEGKITQEWRIPKEVREDPRQIGEMQAQLYAAFTLKDKDE